MPPYHFYKKKKYYLFGLLFFALLWGHLTLVWINRLYPFIDLPDHLATATIVRHYGEPDNRFADFYSIGSFLFKPNVAHILFCSSSLFPTVEFANRIYYSIYIVLLPLSIFFIIRYLGGAPHYSLLSFLLIYNCNVSWGFCGYTLSIPIFLLTFLAMIAYIRSQLYILAIILGCLFVLIFLIHALMAIFTISMFFVLVLIHRKNLIKSLLTGLLVTLPVLTIIVIWWSHREVSSSAGPGFIFSLIQYYGTNYLASLPGRARLIVFDNYFLFPGIWGCLIAALFFGIVLAPSISFLIKPTKIYQALRAPETCTCTPVLALLLWSLFCFMVLPGEIFNFQILYPRFSVIFLAAAIVLGSLVKSTKITRWSFAVFFVGCVLHLILWGNYFRDFNVRNVEFTKNFFPRDSREKVLAGVVYDLDFRGKPIYFHFPSYYIVWTQGIATFRIVDLIDFAPPVRRKEGGQFIPRYSEWAWLAGNFDPSYLLADYLLIRGKAGKGFNIYESSFRMLKSAGKWKLYERKTGITGYPGPSSLRP